MHRYLTRLVPPDDAAELVQETYFRLLRHGELVRVEAMARALLERAIANLPLETRTVFLLHRFRDLSYLQIAQITRLSARTVARRMAEAIEQLTLALGQAI